MSGQHSPATGVPAVGRRSRCLFGTTAARSATAVARTVATSPAGACSVVASGTGSDRARSTGSGRTQPRSPVAVRTGNVVASVMGAPGAEVSGALDLWATTSATAPWLLGTRARTAHRSDEERTVGP